MICSSCRRPIAKGPVGEAAGNPYCWACYRQLALGEGLEEKVGQSDEQTTNS